MTHKERRRAQRRSERRNRPGAARSDSDGSEVPDASAGDELSDCSSDVSVTGDGDGGDVSDTVAVCGEWEELFSDMPVIMHYNYDSGQVHLHDAEGQVLGRVKPIVGRPTVAIYCRQHQCSCQINVAKLPDHESLMSWFRDGLGIPGGKSGQAEHVAKLKALCSS